MIISSYCIHGFILALVLRPFHTEEWTWWRNNTNQSKPCTLRWRWERATVVTILNFRFVMGGSLPLSSYQLYYTVQLIVWSVSDHCPSFCCLCTVCDYGWFPCYKLAYSSVHMSFNMHCLIQLHKWQVVSINCCITVYKKRVRRWREHLSSVRDTCCLYYCHGDVTWGLWHTLICCIFAVTHLRSVWNYSWLKAGLEKKILMRELLTQKLHVEGPLGSEKQTNKLYCCSLPILHARWYIQHKLYHMNMS